ncbi:MAG: hypothetical protein D6761_09255 [Candidatus Dadabacteria bacterium]|nr:MAG: hypothetical protein D6761_09255 [Candidatus Dadabacteria bacterium]
MSAGNSTNKTIDTAKIVEIAQAAARRYANLAGEAQNAAPITTDIPTLIFPCKRDGTIRRSEQELRQLFIEELKAVDKSFRPVFYAVEVPTSLRYTLGKSTKDIHVYESNQKAGRSASIDLTIFTADERRSKLERTWNIEFKLGNPEEHAVAKDVVKLAREPENGAFLQILENTDSKTWENVFKKLSSAACKMESLMSKGSGILLVAIATCEVSGKQPPIMIYREFKLPKDLAALKKQKELRSLDEAQKKGWQLSE